MRKLALSDEILLQIEKPSRYIGNEVNAVDKSESPDFESMIRFCICFPDVLEIGMSHLGIQILYDIFNICMCNSLNLVKNLLISLFRNDSFLWIAAAAFTFK